MPSKPARPCRYPRCPVLTFDASGYCAAHLKETRQQTNREYDAARTSSAQRGYDRHWSKYRLSYLAEHPLCVKCLAERRTVAATVVDHIIPHRGDPALFWDPDNHQPLCERHHNQKTAAEDGAFGNPVSH